MYLNLVKGPSSFKMSKLVKSYIYVQINLLIFLVSFWVAYFLPVLDHNTLAFVVEDLNTLDS